MPRWAKILLMVIGGLCALALALAGIAFAIYVHGPDPKDEKLGGAWEIRQLGSWVIDSGTPAKFLQRVHGKTRTNVAQRPFPYRYLGDDCVVYVVFESGLKLRAACGDRPPILIAESKEAVPWDQVQTDPIRINDAAYSWADIKQHALRGEPF